MLELQRSAGNRAVNQLLLQRDATAGAQLSADRFKNSAKLRACRANRARLREGDADTDATTRVQEALLDLPGKTGKSYDLGPKGADGHYGRMTASAIKKFKGDERLGSTEFGDVGPGTMERLDELFVSDQPPEPKPGPEPLPPEPKPQVNEEVIGPQNPLIAENLEQQVRMHMDTLEEQAEGLLTFDADMDDPEVAKAPPLTLLANVLRTSFDIALDESIGAVIKLGLKAIGTKFSEDGLGKADGLGPDIMNEIQKAGVKAAFGEVAPKVRDAAVPKAIIDGVERDFNETKEFIHKQLEALGLRQENEIKGLAIRHFLRNEYRNVIRAGKEGVNKALSPKHKETLQTMSTAEREKVNRVQARLSGRPATPEEVDGIKSYDDPIAQKMDPRVARANAELKGLADMKEASRQEYYDARLKSWTIATARAGIAELNGKKKEIDKDKTDMTLLGKNQKNLNRVPGILQVELDVNEREPDRDVGIKKLRIAGLSEKVRDKLNDKGPSIETLGFPLRLHHGGDLDIRQSEDRKTLVNASNKDGNVFLNRHHVLGPGGGKCVPNPAQTQPPEGPCATLGAERALNHIRSLHIGGFHELLSMEDKKKKKK